VPEKQCPVFGIWCMEPAKNQRAQKCNI